MAHCHTVIWEHMVGRAVPWSVQENSGQDLASRKQQDVLIVASVRLISLSNKNNQALEIKDLLGTEI